MTRLVVWPLVAAIVLFAALIGLPRLIPHDTHDLQAFFAAPKGCAAPCWAGIRPGITRLDEAIQILQQHPWVGHMAMEGELASGKTSALIWWHWNGQQSPLIDGDVDGRLISDNDVVKFIVISTRIPMGDARIVLGPPLQGRLGFDQTDSTGSHYSHVAVYSGIGLQSPATCPVRVADLWRVPVQIFLDPTLPNAAYGPYDLPRWLADPPC